MNNDTRRVVMLSGCLLLAVVGGLMVHTMALRLAIGGAALLAVLLIVRQKGDPAAQNRGEHDDPPAPIIDPQLGGPRDGGSRCVSS